MRREHKATGRTELAGLPKQTVPTSRAVITAKHAGSDSGLNTFTADLYSDYRRVRAILASSESRLLDHLNDSQTTIDVEPVFAQGHSRRQSDLTSTRTQISKTRVLFVVPLAGRSRNHGKAIVWHPSARHRCWAALGPYNVMGLLYADAGPDPHIARGRTGNQFIPLTGVTLYCPDGSIEHHNTLLVNRAHLDILAIKEM